MKNTKWSAALWLVGLVACAPPPEPKTADESTETAESRQGSVEEKTPESDSAKLVEHRRAFMKGCNAKLPGAPDYCECSWEQMTKTFSEEELGREGSMTPAKRNELQNRVRTACGSKMPESHVKQTFMARCGNSDKIQPFCECTWKTFRKTLSLGDMVDPQIGKTERFGKAKKAAAKACANTLPPAVAKGDFIRGCASAGATEKFCDCAWKVTTKTHPIIHVQLGLVNMSALKPQIKKSCGSPK